MAIRSTQECSFGESRALYIRLNNVEASNHGVASVALFRGFISEAAYKAGNSFVFEKEVQFEADVSQPLWPQAYTSLKADAQFADAQDD